MFMAFFFIVCLFVSSRVQWYRRWSIVWSPCPQAHVAVSRILNRWRYALVFPCPVNIAAIFCVTLIFVVNLFWTVGKYCLVVAALVQISHSFCQRCMESSCSWSRSETVHHSSAPWYSTYVFGIQILTPGLQTPSICVLPSPKRTNFRAHMKRHVKMGEITV